MPKEKLHISFHDPLEVIEKKIDEWFAVEENKQSFLKYLEEENKKPCWTHLHCMEPCEHLRPLDADMGTIEWCDKYLVGQEELCEKECGKRWSYEPSFGPLEEEE